MIANRNTTMRFCVVPLAGLVVTTLVAPLDYHQSAIPGMCNDSGEEGAHAETSSIMWGALHVYVAVLVDRLLYAHAHTLTHTHTQCSCSCSCSS